MANPKPVRAFCGYHPTWGLRPSLCSTHGRMVRYEIGGGMAHSGETPAQGWQRARRGGWRVVPVVISPRPGRTEERS